MTWKALEFLGNLHSSDKIAFGFESMFMIKNVQFKKVNKSFQSQLSEDIKQIKRDCKIFRPADRFRNIYKMDMETNENLLHENTTKTYKKSDKKEIRAINIDAKKS